MVYGLIESGRAAPSTFILDKNGVITWKHIGRTISDRIGPYSILQQLHAIRKLAPQATLRAAWLISYHAARSRSYREHALKIFIGTS